MHPRLTNSLRFSAALAVAVFLGACGQADKKTTGGPASAVQAKLDAIRQAGEPATLAECNTAYAEVPAEENAATLYAEAFAALTPADQNNPPAVAKNQKALELLHQAAARSKSRYPLDLTAGINAQLPHLAKLKACGQLLEQEAVLNAGKGRVDLAAASVMANLALARSLEQEPTLISQLVRIAILQLAVNSLEQALSQKPFAEPELERLQAALHAAEEAGGAALTRGLCAERCMGLSIFQGSTAEMAGALTATGTAGTRAADLDRYRKSPAFAQDFALYLDTLGGLIEATKEISPKALDAANALSAEAMTARSKNYLISAALIPALGKTVERTLSSAATLRCAQAGLAAERHRLTHAQALPASLTELVPALLTAVPNDPFDDQPLRLRTLSPKGYVIYSVGPDQQDDQGTPKAGKASANAPYDITFTIKR